YQHLMNYLQLASGAGMGQYFDFDLSAFAGRFDLGMPESLSVIKVLEQEGLLSFLQQSWLPARGRFITGKEGLYDFEKGHPNLEPLIHALLRTYEGIFDQPVTIREKQLAFLTRRTQQEVTAGLLQLQAFHIFEYTPPKD